jgi:hypothetical protein
MSYSVLLRGLAALRPGFKPLPDFGKEAGKLAPINCPPCSLIFAIDFIRELSHLA